tara:strand:- start:282 stop:431 length:150 start_codon:yes stop_codon:yes gene_type:complete
MQSQNQYLKPQHMILDMSSMRFKKLLKKNWLSYGLGLQGIFGVVIIEWE